MAVHGNGTLFFCILLQSSCLQILKDFVCFSRIHDELKRFATKQVDGSTFFRSRILVIGIESVFFAVIRQQIHLPVRSPHTLSGEDVGQDGADVVVAHWGNPLTVQREQSDEQSSIPGRAPALECHDKGSRSQ